MCPYFLAAFALLPCRQSDAKWPFFPQLKQVPVGALWDGVEVVEVDAGRGRLADLEDEVDAVERGFDSDFLNLARALAIAERIQKQN